MPPIYPPRTVVPVIVLSESTWAFLISETSSIYPATAPTLPALVLIVIFSIVIPSTITSSKNPTTPPMYIVLKPLPALLTVQSINVISLMVEFVALPAISPENTLPVRTTVSITISLIVAPLISAKIPV